MKLYEIANEYQMILSQLESGEITDEQFQEEVGGLTTSAEDKIKNVAYIIKTLQAEKEIIDTECKRLEKKKDAHENRIEWLRSYLSHEMERLHIDKVLNKPYFNVSLRDGKFKLNPATLNEVLVPDEYKLVNQVVKLDKKKILDEMLAGVVIPGAEVIREKYVEIR